MQATLTDERERIFLFIHVIDLSFAPQKRFSIHTHLIWQLKGFFYI